MRILIVNDDGIHADGIRTLAARLKRDHAVTVVAPESEKSAASHAITIYRPLRARKTVPAGLEDIGCYVVDGLPVDCTKVGISHVMQNDVDIVVSGINHGPNLGSDVIYSGTVAAAMDAVIMGYHALAVSIAAYNPQHLDTAAEIAARVIDSGIIGTQKEILYNLNVPDLPLEQIKGIKAAPQGRTVYDDGVELREDPRGSKYIWVTGTLREIEQPGETDIGLVNQGYATLTPLTFDLTAKEHIETLSCKLEKLELHD